MDTEAWKIKFSEQLSKVSEKTDGAVLQILHMAAELLAAYDELADKLAYSNECSECHGLGGYHTTGCSNWLWQPKAK